MFSTADSLPPQNNSEIIQSAVEASSSAAPFEEVKAAVHSLGSNFINVDSLESAISALDASALDLGEFASKIDIDTLSPVVLDVLSSVNVDGLARSLDADYLLGKLEKAIDSSNSKDRLSGRSGEIALETDSSGVPRIEASTLGDSVLGQGFVHARDRLWQMEFQRRAANGTLSEVLGSDTLSQDTFVRTLGLNGIAAMAYEDLSSEARELVDAYTAGVNAYLDSDPELPTEFSALGYEPAAWSPVDVMATAQLQIFSVGTTDGGELTRTQLLQRGISPERIAELLPDRSAGDPTILSSKTIEQQTFSVSAPTPESVAQSAEIARQIPAQLASLFPALEASNSWVISGDRTTTGKPFLANDPHLNLQGPSVWYQAELSSPETAAVGASLPGLPGIQIGQNRDIAWGQTATQVDAQDYYLLQEDADQTGYQYNGELRPYTIREETIEVKDADPVTLSVRESIYGPVVSEVVGVEQPVALNAVGLDPADGVVEALLGVNLAQDWDDFRTSLSTVENPISNFVYADTQGNIGYIAPGNYPVRQPGHTGEYPVIGDGTFDWQGFIPESEVPQAYNPDTGYIVTANNQQVPDNYPYAINGSFAIPYRARRITALIEAKDRLSFEDMKAIQLDQVSLLYRDFRPVLEQIAPTSSRGMEWRDRLLAWDGDTDPASKEASVFEAWILELEKLPAEEVGNLRVNSQFLLNALLSGDAICGEDDCADEVTAALEAALVRLGEEIPEWGEIHQVNFEPLSPVQSTSAIPVALGGDRSTVNVSPVGAEDFDTSFGVSYRQIVDLDNPGNSVYINPPGQSSDSTSNNFQDQLSFWQQGDYLSVF